MDGILLKTAQGNLVKKKKIIKKKEATQIVHLIVYVNCLSLPPRQWGF